MSEYRILILAYDFPPNESIGGQRPWFWIKYLHEHGIYPVVITRHWNNNIATAIECAKPSENKVASDDQEVFSGDVKNVLSEAEAAIGTK